MPLAALLGLDLAMGGSTDASGPSDLHMGGSGGASQEDASRIVAMLAQAPRAMSIVDL